ncbi:Auxin transport protein (BIG) isoform 1 [Dorcoceras hygrometricum]|uniref:Auxin transport protein (BIG) isoform 1 n=1 Tax=Dorcoceras hygrometricum TaxID=472368 RepID=A0A2Z7CFK8_9LAMI|nr:Auxin transport protein (BIG) isoform 1 [Dorcoceras hygrometricum]
MRNCVRAVRLCRLFLKSVHRVFGRFCAGRDWLAPLRNLSFGNCCSEAFSVRFVSCVGEICALFRVKSARAFYVLYSKCLRLVKSGCFLAAETTKFLFSFVRFVVAGNPSFTAGRGFNPAGGAPGGG